MSHQEVQSTGYDVRFGKCQYFTAFETKLAKFAIFCETIASYDGPLQIDLPEYTVIILAPLVSQKRVFIRAKSIILLDSLTSENEEVVIEYSGSYVNFGAEISCPQNDLIVGPTEVKDCKISQSIKKKIVEHFKRGVKNTDGICILDALGMVGEQAELKDNKD